jgi:hypothetical protein
LKQAFTSWKQKQTIGAVNPEANRAERVNKGSIAPSNNTQAAKTGTKQLILINLEAINCQHNTLYYIQTLSLFLA